MYHEKLYVDEESVSESTEFLRQIEPQKKKSGLRKFLTVRLLFEMSVVAMFIGLFASGSVRPPLVREDKDKRYGPRSEL
jgi:hypothetical protein